MQRMGWSMNRSMPVMVGCMALLMAATARAQVTRITPLNHSSDSAPAATVAVQPATVRSAAKTPVQSPDPYRALQAAYQPLEPADIPPTLNQGAPGTNSPSTVAPNTYSTTPGASSLGAAPGIISPSPSATPLSASPADCTYTTSPATTVTPPATTYVPSTTVPYVSAPAVVSYTPTTVVTPTPTVPVVRAGFPPVLPISSTDRPVMVSQGLLGQPVVYVPGQPVRNFLRYLTP